MPSKPKTWKAIADQRRKENFVGRTEQQQIFQDNFTNDDPVWMILSVTGEGGVGKSTLLKRYTQFTQTSEINANVVICDDHQYTPVDVMAALSDQLAKLGIESKDFSERHKKYREILQQIESDPSAPRSMVNIVMRGLTDFTIKSLRRVPGIGVAADYVDEQAAGDALAELAQYTISRWGNKDEVQLVREPEKILTPLFVELLNNATQSKRLVVMFDVFERTASTLSSWLIDLFGAKHGEISSWVSFVLSGRDPLEQYWTELAGLITHLQLEPFTPEETSIYLSNQGIVDETLVKQIYEDTGGLPVLVELLASTNPQPGSPLPDISKDAVERFLQWTPDESKRRAALAAATPRQFNQEILQVLLGEEQGKLLFQWLSDQSFIRSNTERGYFYHDKVRSLILRHQMNTTPKELSQLHTSLAGYFEQLQVGLGVQGRDAYKIQEWRKFELERIYHLFCSAPEKHFTSIMDSFMSSFMYHWKFSEPVVRAVKHAAHDSHVDSFAKDLNRIDELVYSYDRDDYERVIQILNELQRKNEISPTSQNACFYRRGICYYELNEFAKAIENLGCVIGTSDESPIALTYRGNAYRLLKKYEEALRDLDRAVDLDEKYAWAIASRAETYRLMGRNEDAIKDFDRAISLDEKYTWAIASRGETYCSIGKHKEALIDFNQAISLNNNYKWAILQRRKVFERMRIYDEALADTKRLIDLNPTTLGNYSEYLRLIEQKDGSALSQFMANKIDALVLPGVEKTKTEYLNPDQRQSTLEKVTKDIADEIRYLARTFLAEVFNCVDKEKNACEEGFKALVYFNSIGWAVENHKYDVANYLTQGMRDSLGLINAQQYFYDFQKNISLPYIYI